MIKNKLSQNHPYVFIYVRMVFCCILQGIRLFLPADTRKNVVLHPGGIKNDQIDGNLSGNPLKKNVKSDILLKDVKLKKAEGKR